MSRNIFAIAVCAVLTSCGKPGAPTTTAPTSLSVRAQGVRLASSKVEAGKATEAQLQQGLQSAADILSALYAEARKARPQLKGHLRGTFHIEADGTPRMFMERGSEFTPPEGKTISDDFVGATFGGKWKFPKIGSDLMLAVDYELAPGS
ncbi:MAG TPA: hypothetical protein VN578_11800 [Candidatus Binatia bacterium]|jgi:hypothetical protein|nr:hypothetical protein [Candidatus Binatia bacterium]